MTPGQKAYEAFRASAMRHGHFSPWEESPWQADFEVAAAAILEEAAQIADKHGAYIMTGDAAIVASQIAEEIRALTK